jgi:hypothetical protein
MGIDKSLSDNYPSVIFDGMQFHYGREPTYGRYLVEHVTNAEACWCFDHKDDLVAFLLNLPWSAIRDRVQMAHPNWNHASAERRAQYIEEDRALLRERAAAMLLAGTAPTFDTDLEGLNGPHIPQRIPDPEIPSIRESLWDQVERQARFNGHSFESALKNAAILLFMETLDWTGVDPQDKKAVFAETVAFERITPDQFAWVYRALGDVMFETPDPTLARSLFEREHQNHSHSQFDHAGADYE